MDSCDAHLAETKSLIKVVVVLEHSYCFNLKSVSRWQWLNVNEDGNRYLFTDPRSCL